MTTDNQIKGAIKMAIGLTSRRDEIIGLRESGLTYAEIGRRFRISRERVRQIVKIKKPKEVPKKIAPNSTVMLRSGDVARLLGLHSNTVRRWSDKGILKVYRIGPRGDRRFHRKDVQRFLNGVAGYL